MRKLNNPEKLVEEAKRKAEGQSMLLFSKKSHDADGIQPDSLEDFEILKVIDKGSFGKVFLVKFKKTG